MDRAELKEEAKKKIKDNKWYIWKPYVFFGLIVFLISFVIFLPLALLVDESVVNVVSTILSCIASLVGTVFAVGYSKYCLDFVRGKKQDWKACFDFIKKHFGTVILLSILIGLIILGGMLLLIVPGIIFAIGHSLYQEVYADNPELSATEAVKKSWNLTKGYKKDIFVLYLSFIGWQLLAVLTLGILYIWLTPYMTVTQLLFYEELVKKEKTKKN